MTIALTACALVPLAADVGATTAASVLPRTISLKTGVTPITYTVLDKNGAPTTYTGAAVASQRGTGWLDPSTATALAGASWVSTDLKEGTVTGVGEHATTRYRATFTLPTGYSVPSLAITLAADDGAKVLLNGHQIAAQTLSYTADDDKYHRQGWNYSTADATFFQVGANTLDVVVEDYDNEVGILYAATVAFTPPVVDVTGVTLTGDGTTGIGLGTLGLTGLPVSALEPGTGPVGSAPIARTPIARTPIARTPIARTPIARTPIARTPIARTLLALAPIARTPIARTPIARTPIARTPLGLLLESTPLSSIPVLTAGGWPALLAKTTNLKAALPQDVTFQDVLNDPTPPAELVDPTCGVGTSTCQPVTFGQILLDGTPLGDLPLVGLLLDGLQWGDITGLTGGPATGSTGILAGIFDRTSPVLIEATNLADLTIGALGSGPRQPLFRSMPLAGLNVAGTFLGDVTYGALATPAAVFDCSKLATCSATTTLRSAAGVTGGIRSAATFGDLGTAINGATLADLVLTFADPTTLPWEDLSLAGSHFERLYPGTADVPGLRFTHQTLSFGLPCGESATATVTLASGFAYRIGSSTISVAGAAATALADPASDAQGLHWTVPANACPPSTPGGSSPTDATVIDFQVLPGFSVGSAGKATAAVAANGAGAVAGSASLPVTIVPTVPGSTDLDPNAIVAGQIAGPDDVDRYTVTVPPGQTLTVSVSHLTYDGDLVLYPPAGAGDAGLLHGTAAQAIPAGIDPVADPGGATGATLPPPVLADIPLLPGRDVAGISAFRGKDAESVSTTTVEGTGTGKNTYTIQVSGYNGASGADPYVLVVRTAAPPVLPPCPAVTAFNNNDVSAVDLMQRPSGDAVDTLFVVDRGRLVDAYGAGPAQTIIDGLRNQAAFSTAAIVQVDGSPAVNAAFKAWDASPCDVAKSNAVVKAIDDYVDSVRTADKNVKNVVIVGDGTIVPHAALADTTSDTNERDFTGDTITGGQSSAVTGAVGHGFFLSDAPYGTFTPLSVRGQVVYLPQVALGRLGGDAAAIAANLSAFASSPVAGASSTAPHTAFESDYSFFADLGAQLADTFGAAGQGRDLTGSLSGSGWTAAQLLANAFGNPAGIIVPNGHADPTRLLSAAGSTTGSNDLVTSAQVAAQGASLQARILFTIGCHFALDLPGVNSWEQVLQGKGAAVMVGNLGYGIGDTASVAFSERLLSTYARMLDGSRTAGQGLVDAQQLYFRSLSAFSPYDLKVLQQMTLWGLPMYQLPHTGATAPTTAVAGPAITDPVTGNTTATVAITPSFHTTYVADAGTGGARAFVDADGQSSTVHPYPILPQVVADIPTVPGKIAHGAIPLVWAIDPAGDRVFDGTNPKKPDGSALAPGGYAFANATLADARLEPAAPSLTVYPTGFANVGTSYGADGTARQQLVVTPAQFRSVDPQHPQFGTLRTFTDATWLVTYSSEKADFDGPRFGALDVVTDGISAASPAGTSTVISAAVTDAKGGVTRVIVQVLRQTPSGTFYVPLELFRVGTTDRWSNVIGVTDVVEVTYFALDGFGNASSANNKGPGYVTRPATPTGDGTGGVISFTPSPGPTGWFTAAPSASTTGGYKLRLDGGALLASLGPIADGAHLVESVSPPQGATVGATGIHVDATPPTITIAGITPPENANHWRTSDATVSFSCADATSGLASCTPPTLVTGEGAALEATGTATDVAGNTASVTATPIRIDRTPPGLVGGATTSPNAAGWYNGDVTVHWTGADALSGIDAVTPDEVLTAETTGTTRSGTATDRAGNATAATSPVIRIDRTAPSVTAAPSSLNRQGKETTAPNAAGWWTSDVTVNYTCADALSGVDSCPPPRTASGNGAGQYVTSAAARDAAGNAAALVVSGPFNIDGLDPQSSIGSDCTTLCTIGLATITITAADQVGLAGVREIHYAVDGGAPTVVTGQSTTFTLSALGFASHTISYYAVDNADNVEPANTATYSFDVVAPTLTHTVAPVPNAAQWNSTAVVVHFIAVDNAAGSGIKPGTVTPDVTVATEGITTVNGTVQDLSGNVGHDTAVVQIDRTPPTVTLSTLTTPNAAGWFAAPVTVHLTCADGLSGLTAPCPADATVSANGTTVVSRTVADVADNTTTVTRSLAIDALAPTVSVGGVANGGVYTLGAVPVPTCVGADSVSGIASCAVATTGGTANKVGTFTSKATATDRAGNTSTASVTYKVLYRWAGFSAPTTANGATAIIRAGVNAPVDFKVTDAAGKAVRLAVAPAWAPPTRGTRLGSTTTANSRGTTLPGTGGSSYVYETATGNYLYVWPTTSAQAGYYWQITVTLDDGTTHTILLGVSGFKGSDRDGPEDADDPTHVAKS